MPESNIRDLVIIGAGPAGLTAAVYARRALLDTVLLERESVGGQMLLTAKVDNYPGVTGLDGYEISESMHQQVTSFGVEPVYAEARGIAKRPDDLFDVRMSTDGVLTCRAVIVALGASAKMAGFKNEQKFVGRGVSYCATCDGMFYRSKRVYVIGGGNSALEEAILLSRIAESVTLVVRKDHLAASRSLSEEVSSVHSIRVMYQSKVVCVEGPGLIDSIEFEGSDGLRWTETFEPGAVGVFVAVGRSPQTDMLTDLCELDENGYVLTDESRATTLPGLFAAGDIIAKPLRQIVTAASDGAIAAASSAAYIQNRDNISYVK